jgi:ribose 1,5-bisphosphate isomerase
MSDHPAIKTVVERIKTDVIGGAADTAKEVVTALTALTQDSQATDREAFVSEVDTAVIDVMRVMPSLAPPVNALHRILGTMEEALAEDSTLREIKTAMKDASARFLVSIETALDKVAQFGAEKIQNGNVVFMYSMSSTVWRILRAAKSNEKSFRVVVTESRPANEGLWTVSEMEKSEIPVSVSIDACIGELIPQCDIVFVGADAISSHGSALCKVGTYPSALVAQVHGVPFYIAADTLKFDSSTLLGLPFRVDPIHRHEVLPADQDYSDLVKVSGHLFDETPPHLVTAIISEIGLLNPTACFNVMWQMKLSNRLSNLLPAWARNEL